MRMPRLHLSLALLSIAMIAFQLVLIQILSITQWHHFAYMVISVSLLGFGASGTVLALARGWLLERIACVLPALMIACAASMPAVTALSQSALGGFDSYLLFLEPAQAWRLLRLNLLFAAPFFLGALAVGMVFTAHTGRIGTLYFANLSGSGLGGLVGVALLFLLPPATLPSVVALLALAAGLFVLPPDGKGRLLAGTLPAVALIAWLLIRPFPLALSPYKDLRHALNLPGARIVAQRDSPYGLVQIVSSPALRYAPGLSLAYSGKVPVSDVVFSNGNWFGAVPLRPPAKEHVLDFTTSALPYALAKPQSVLVLHAGTGMEVVRALSRGAGKVIAVEPHRQVPELLREIPSGEVFDSPRVTLDAVEPRTFLAADRGRYDLVVLPSVGVFGGAAGLFALQEQNTLTVEALAEAWRHLSPDGMLAVTVWMDYPPRAPLRLASTLAEMLKREGIADPTPHLAAVRNWGDITFCLKRSPLTPQDVERVRAFCGELLFDPALLPGLAEGERVRHHRMENEGFFDNLDRAFSPSRGKLVESYPFRLSPPTDDRPFFSQFLRWGSLPQLIRLFGERSVPFLEMGYLIVIVAFVQLTAAAVVLILLPLLRLGWRGEHRLRTLLYFSGLGVGYMLVEIVLIHRFVLYLGNPVLAAAAAISAVLVFSGIGSSFSSRIPDSALKPHRAALRVALLLLLYTALLPPVLHGTIALPLAWKVPFALLLLAPPAFAMGFPFPLGLRRLSLRSEADVPWAWGINGCLSVVSTALATIIAVELGFTAVLLLAAGAYGVAAMAGVRG